jgi:hypothetical protein
MSAVILSEAKDLMIIPDDNSRSFGAQPTRDAPQDDGSWAKRRI